MFGSISQHLLRWIISQSGVMLIAPDYLNWVNNKFLITWTDVQFYLYCGIFPLHWGSETVTALLLSSSGRVDCLILTGPLYHCYVVLTHANSKEYNNYPEPTRQHCTLLHLVLILIFTITRYDSIRKTATVQVAGWLAGCLTGSSCKITL